MLRKKKWNFQLFCNCQQHPKKDGNRISACPEFGQAFRVEYWAYFKKVKFILYFPKNGFSSPPWKFWAGSGQACPEILSAVFSRKMTVIDSKLSIQTIWDPIWCIFPKKSLVNTHKSCRFVSFGTRFDQKLLRNYPKSFRSCDANHDFVWIIICSAQSFSLPKKDGNELPTSAHSVNICAAGVILFGSMQN